MKYERYNIDKYKERIWNEGFKNRWRMNEKDFTRNRKITMPDIVTFNLNNRGKTLKMELYDYTKQFGLDKVSSPAMLKQREKFNPEGIKYLAVESMKDFYNKFPQEVKTFKGFVLAAIDGSDCEVPNTKETRKRYKSINCSDDDRVARIKLSNCYDVLNNYVLDTLVEEYKHYEVELANRHIQNTKYIENFKVIYVMDRGYISLASLYHWIKKDVKFVVRLNKKYLKVEQESMTTDDEFVEIRYQYDRIRNYKDKDVEFYNYYENGNTIKIRFTNIKLPTGEIETLLSNLSLDEFTTEDMNYIYQCRWGIETSYHSLKESMKITNISSSKEIIIMQEIYSQMAVYNIVQSIANDMNAEIDQSKYKHPMKVNFNMAVGFVKGALITILIEEDVIKQERLFNELQSEILENLVPIRKNRHYERCKNKKLTNKYPINKRKSF